MEEVHHTVDTVGMSSDTPWETWPAFSTGEWDQGVYEAVVTCTDLIEGVSVTGTTSFSVL